MNCNNYDCGHLTGTMIPGEGCTHCGGSWEENARENAAFDAGCTSKNDCPHCAQRDCPNCGEGRTLPQPESGSIPERSITVALSHSEASALGAALTFALDTVGEDGETDSELRRVLNKLREAAR